MQRALEAELLSFIDAYLDSRTIRFPEAVTRTAAAAGSSLSQWQAKSPVFVGRDGDRITRGTLQSRIKRAFKRAGPDAQPVPGARGPRTAPHLRDGTRRL
jgi:integrase/recombinase XerC